jgi:hypothetical protein
MRRVMHSPEGIPGRVYRARWAVAGCLVCGRAILNWASFRKNYSVPV